MTDAAQFTARVIQDALTAGTATYWRRRTDVYEWARPKPGDYTGRATEDQLRARDEALALMARACRVKADLLDESLREVAP